MGSERRSHLPGDEENDDAAWGNGDTRPPHPCGEKPLGTVERPSRRKLSAGDQFGEWRLVEFDRNYWLCQCTCGVLRWVPTDNLTMGKSRACVRCANRKTLEARGYLAKTLGIAPKHATRLANRYYALRRRCSDPADSCFLHYGGRGIECRFETTEDALRHFLTLPGWDIPEAEIDRIDNHGHYEPGNLRFTDRRGNASNTRVNRVLEYNGRRYTATRFWREHAPAYRDAGTVGRKVRAGLSAEQIIADQSNCRGPYLRRSKRGAE